jgi:hypothetical protein
MYTILLRRAVDRKNEHLYYGVDRYVIISVSGCAYIWTRERIAQIWLR